MMFVRQSPSRLGKNLSCFPGYTECVISPSYNLCMINNLGTGHYLWRGVAPKRNVFRGKNFADLTIRKSKIDYSTSTIN
jgi:hypothetical protein